MDVVLGHHRVGRCQVQQVVVPGLCALQLVLRVLGLSLWGEGEGGGRRSRGGLEDQRWQSRPVGASPGEDASSYQHRNPPPVLVSFWKLQPTRAVTVPPGITEFCSTRNIKPQLKDGSKLLLTANQCLLARKFNFSFKKSYSALT